MSDTEDFAQRLCFLRKQKGLSQEKLADLLNISVMTVRRWEWGQRVPRMEEIKRLSEVFCITESDLLNGPSSENWELRILMKKEGVIDMTSKQNSAVLNIGEDAMAITLSAGYELWEDDVKFEELIEQLRKKRKVGLKTRKEDW